LTKPRKELFGMTKRVLLIRHPTVVWTHEILKRAEEQGLDVETFVPVDKPGLRMSQLLAEHLVVSLGEQVNGCQIFSSPIKRTLTLAEIIFAEFYSQDDTAFPRDITICPHIAEIPWKSRTEDAEEAIERAYTTGEHFLHSEFADDPEGSVRRYNKHLKDNILPALEIFGESSASLMLAFSHSATIGLTLWTVKQRMEVSNYWEVTTEDLRTIAECVIPIRHTSISQISKEDGKWSIDSIGQTPHLIGEELRKGLE